MPTPASVGETIVRFIRALYPVRAADLVSADTRGRVPANTVAKWLERANSPSGPHLLLLIDTYGARLLRELIQAGWVDAAAAREEAEALRRDQAELDARMARVEARL